MRKSILICTLNNSACIPTLPVPPSDYDLVGLGEDLRFYIPNKCPGESMPQVLGQYFKQQVCKKMMMTQYFILLFQDLACELDSAWVFRLHKWTPQYLYVLSFLRELLRQKLGSLSQILNKATLLEIVTPGYPFFPLSPLIPGTLFSDFSVSALRPIIDVLQLNSTIRRLFAVISQGVISQ